MTEAFQRRVEAAAASVDFLPRVDTGVVLGSGLGGLVDSVKGTVIPYSDIQDYPVPSVSGHQGILKVADIDGRSVAFMAGRFHFYEGWSMDDVVMPVFLLSRLGAERR